MFKIIIIGSLKWVVEYWINLLVRLFLLNKIADWIFC